MQRLFRITATLYKKPLCKPNHGTPLNITLNKFKKAYITQILDETAWNQTEAGKILGIQRTYVSRLLNELHIR